MAGDGIGARGQVDFAMRLSPLDPLYYAMLGVRGLSHLAQGDDAEAARWLQRAARSPGAHALISMLAAAAELMAGNEPAARLLAATVHERDPRLARADFFRAFPFRSDTMRARFSAALKKLAF